MNIVDRSKNSFFLGERQDDKEDDDCNLRKREKQSQSLSHGLNSSSLTDGLFPYSAGEEEISIIALILVEIKLYFCLATGSLKKVGKIRNRGRDQTGRWLHHDDDRTAFIVLLL